MQTRVSTKGQVVLPNKIRKSLGIEAGDALDAKVEAGRIVLTPKKTKKYRGRIIKDPVTGFPVLTFGKGAPVLTNEDVAKLLVDFP